MSTSFHEWSISDRARALDCLERVLASQIFTKAERQKRFLHYVVTRTLEGQAGQLKGYTIAVEVFERPPSFDPAVDTIVRVEAMRLRAKLREYYDGEGRSDPVRFELPKGTYAVRVLFPVQAQTRTGAVRQPVPVAAAGHSAAAVTQPRPIEDMPSLAVLPFANISADVEQEYFADGITEDLITELSRLSGLFVISRHSSFVYKGVSKRADEIGAELGVRYLLEGSVQRAGDRVRITAQLVDAASGAHLWAEHYDRELSDIFALQDDVTRRIVAVLQVKLAGTESEHLGHEGTVSMEAHDALLHGLERFWAYTPESTEEARAYFERAIELDPGYAMAHAWLARTLVAQWIFLWDLWDENLERALDHARTAVDLDERLPYGHSVLCWVQLWRKQGEAAIDAGWRAVALDPNNADAHLFLTMALVAAGRGEEALHYIEKAIRLNPHPPALYQLALGLSYVVLEEYDKALQAFQRGIEMTDVFIPNHYWLCMVYTLLGREEEARAELGKIMALREGRTPIIQNFWLNDDMYRRYHHVAQLAGLD